MRIKWLNNNGNLDLGKFIPFHVDVEIEASLVVLQVEGVVGRSWGEIWLDLMSGRGWVDGWVNSNNGCNSTRRLSFLSI